jgi:signal transduction histidine kinase
MRRLPLIDVIVAAVLLVFGELAALGGETSLPRWLSLALTALYTAPLAVRRRAPLLACACTLAGVLALGLADPEGSQPTIPLALALAAFTVGAELPVRASSIAIGVGLAAMLAALLATDRPAGELVVVLVLYGGPWLFGRALRRREAERGAAEQQAAEAERARLARELHDVVSHSISVIALQAQAVRRRLRPEQQREANDLRAVEVTARQAMAEMRRLFGVLRADGEPAPLAPQPGLDQLPLLLEQTRAAGLPVELRVEGDPEPLSPGVDLAAYRIVQEALTNAVRHAGPATATVLVRYDTDALELRVEDDGRGPSGAANGGHGLTGMRERVALYGGRLELGARPGGGYRVCATLPIREGAA